MMWSLKYTSLYVLTETDSKPEACQRLHEGSGTGEVNHLEIYLWSLSKATHKATHITSKMRRTEICK